MTLPYLEQGNLANLYNYTVNWSNAANNPVSQTQIKLFLCPSAPAGRVGANNHAELDYPAINQFVANPSATLFPLPPPDPTFPGVLGYNTSRRLTDITDGTSNTLLLAEDAGRDQYWTLGRQQSSRGNLPTMDGAWPAPAGYINITGYNSATAAIPGPIAINGTNAQNMYAFHPGVAGGLFADGSVRFVNASVSISILIALMTRAGGEVIADGSY